MVLTGILSENLAINYGKNGAYKQNKNKTTAIEAFGQNTSIETLYCYFSNSMERKSIGVLINILGSLSINLGNNLQSSGHRAHKKNTEHEIVSEKEIKIVEESNEGGYYVKEETDFIWALLDCSGGQSGRALIKKLPHIEPLPHKVKSSKTCNNWLIGTCFFLLGTIAVFVSYSFAPQSLIAPLGSVQFVSNIFFARWIHGAKITRRMLVATSVILVGISLVVHFSPDPNPDFAILNGDNIKELYYYYNYQVSVEQVSFYFHTNNWGFIFIFIFFFLFLVIGLHVCTWMHCNIITYYIYIIYPFKVSI